MTAASGVVHEEFHGRNFAERGGLFEAVLWVNLPAKDKMPPPDCGRIGVFLGLRDTAKNKQGNGARLNATGYRYYATTQLMQDDADKTAKWHVHSIAKGYP